MLSSTSDIWVAIPAMDEQQLLPLCLKSLSEQSVTGFNVVVCVNNPEEWWYDNQKRDVCLKNTETLDWLRKTAVSFPFRLHIIDKATSGNGMAAKSTGAGAARKVAMDYACHAGSRNAILVSTDADTQYDASYLADILSRFQEKTDADALAAPYFHNLTEDTEINKAILKYEIFMRLYLLNLFRIDSPFAFTAIGSALAVTNSCYRSAGGVPSKKSGEDFYLLQKIAKRSKVLQWIPSKVYPAARVSNRVDFGTGPTLAEGVAGKESRYSIVHPDHFDIVSELYNMFPLLYEKDIATPADDYLKALYGNHNIWKSLRANSASVETFIKACHQKFDGLRIWQMLRQSSKGDNGKQALIANLKLFLPDKFGSFAESVSEADSDVNLLTNIRNEIFNVEMRMRKENDEKA